VVIAVAKFAEGAWISILLMGATVLLFANTRRYYRRVDRDSEAHRPYEPRRTPPPVIVVPLRRLDRIGRKALNLALSLSPDVYVVQIRAEDDKVEDLSPRWHDEVERPMRERGWVPPRLVMLESEYRELVDPLLEYIHELDAKHPDRRLAVLIPELVERRWYNYLIQSHTATLLKMRLLHGGGPHVVLIDSPWYHR
jgi:hypothetical protein